ncbi:unnamed protein product [Euphydryas editha]|uniref:Uncharacterized protein n=1 Tax=Euphydryas editha TaxID=104508 RepID=A0AAU9USU1_EUPED|nr:unnamed protein product [Euphydryas editha]
MPRKRRANIGRRTRHARQQQVYSQNLSEERQNIIRENARLTQRVRTQTSSTIKMENPLNSVTTEPTQDMFFPETSSTIKMENPLNSVATEPTQDMFFPDNDELESKLKEYELQPDPEGTIYYDGSLHSSDLGLKADSEGFSDIMPGLDSDSRVQVDPLALDLQAQRRANVRRINERIIKMKMA